MDLFIEPDAAAINKALRSMQLLGCLLRNEQGYSWMAFCIVRGDIGKRLKKIHPPQIYAPPTVKVATDS